MSTQNKGVVPDIELPSTWDINKVGESSYPTALSWDVIRPNILNLKWITN